MKGDTAGSKKEEGRRSCQKMTSEFVGWLTELAEMLLKGKGKPRKGAALWERKKTRGVMEKIVVIDFCGSLSSASFDILNTHNNAIENSVNT